MADGQIILPQGMGLTMLRKIHRSSHLGIQRMQDLLRQANVKIQNSNQVIEEIVSKCQACKMSNVISTLSNPSARQRVYWEVDFTEIKSGKFGYKYLLVFIHTFSGWDEVDPTKHEPANVVAKKLIEEILPGYGFPAVIGSNNGPAFIFQVSQGIVTALGTDWKLHCAYRPQSSGQI